MAGMLLRFLAYLVAAVVLLGVEPVDREIVAPWTRFNAAAAAAIADRLGVETRASGTELHSGAVSLNVLQGCNGVHAIAILISAILAAPASWGRRLVGVLVGSLALLGANIARLVNLVVVARYFPAQLDLFHAYVWQPLIVVVAFALFVAWAATVARPALASRPGG